VRMTFGTASFFLDWHAAGALLVAFVAVIFDVRLRRIPNYVTFTAAVAAFVFALFVGGWSGLAWAAGAWVLGAALFFPFFALRGMGAGDVKLMAALGAWLGPADAIWLAIFASMAGGVLGAVVALSRGYLRQSLSNVWLIITHWRVVGVRPVEGFTLSDTRAPRLAYAIPITIGVMCTLWRR
jgi:prepilin peptidase CpaA